MTKIKLTKKQKLKIAKYASLIGYSISVGILAAVSEIIGYERGHEDAMKEVKR